MQFWHFIILAIVAMYIGAWLENNTGTLSWVPGI